MNIQDIIRQSDVCKSIVSWMKSKNTNPGLGIGKQAMDGMKNVNYTPREAVKEVLPSVQMSNKSFLQVFPVLIISELNSPFSIV